MFGLLDTFLGKLDKNTFFLYNKKYVPWIFAEFYFMQINWKCYLLNCYQILNIILPTNFIITVGLLEIP